MTRIRERLTGSNLYLVGLVISMRNDEGIKQIYPWAQTVYPRVFPVSLDLACFVIVIVIIIIIIIIFFFGGGGTMLFFDISCCPLKCDPGI